MKVFYKHVNSNGGVPDEVRAFNKYNRKNISIIESSLTNFSKQIVFTSEKEFLFLGFLFIENLFLWTLCRIFKKKNNYMAFWSNIRFF